MPSHFAQKIQFQSDNIHWELSIHPNSAKLQENCKVLLI